MSTSNILRIISVAEVIAMLCQKHNISIHTINQMIKSDCRFNVYEVIMCEQITQQFNDRELLLDRYNTLDIDCFDNIDDNLKSPSNKSDDSDEDYVPELSEKKPRQNATSITEEQFLKAYKYWTYQEKINDESIITDNNKFLKKRKPELVSRKYKYIDKQCCNLRGWAQRIKKGEKWTIGKINKVVYATFLENRDHHHIVTDWCLRRWALNLAKSNSLGLKFKTSSKWLQAKILYCVPLSYT